MQPERKKEMIYNDATNVKLFIDMEFKLLLFNATALEYVLNIDYKLNVLFTSTSNRYHVHFSKTFFIVKLNAFSKG